MKKILVIAALLGWASTVQADPTQETVYLPINGIKIPLHLHIPAKLEGKVPAVLVVHGSGGARDTHVGAWAKEFAYMGAIGVVIDFYTPRGVKSTSADQTSVRYMDNVQESFAALELLAKDLRIDPNRIAIVGFSRGGTIAHDTAYTIYRQISKATTKRSFALHLAVYPGCNFIPSDTRVTKAPIYIMVGEADTYSGVENCRRQFDVLTTRKANVHFVTYPGAKHAWDVIGSASFFYPPAENWINCLFEHQADGTWKNTRTNETFRNLRSDPKAMACMKRGAELGYNRDMHQKLLQDIKAIVSKTLVSK